MAKFRTSILIIGMLIIVIAASLLTVLALYVTGAVVTERIELIYAVVDVEKVYDGTPLLPEEYELVSGELLNGHYALVEFTGSQTDAGHSKSGLSVKICDARGYDVTGEYKINVSSGLLNVLPREISVVLNDEEVTYNGSKVSFENYSITEGELVAGHKIAGSQNVQLISVNDVLPDDLNVLVFDVTGKDVTKNYDVNFTYNENRIRVVPRPLTVKPVDIIKTYDGVEIDLNTVEILAGSLAEGQYFKSIEINSGSERLIDVCDKVTRITGIAIYQRVGSAEVAVTENYDLDLSETGVVRIEKRKLTITARSQSWEYDGTDHYLSSDEYPAVCEGFVKGEGLLSYDYFGSIKNAGATSNEITNLRPAANTSLDNYDYNLVAGTLTVLKREVTVITPTVSRTYDGTALLGASANDRPRGLNLAPYHEIWYDTESLPKQTVCGTITNNIDYKIIDTNDKGEEKTDLSDNYKITPVYGTITVTKRAARISTRAVTKVFDGRTLYAFESEADIDTYNILTNIGHKLVLPSKDQIPQISDVGITYCSSLTIPVFDENGENVTENYDIDYQFGHLEITRLNITVRTAGDTIEYAGEALQLGEENTEFEGLPDGFEKVIVEGEYPKQEGVGKTTNKVHYTLNYGGAPVDENNYKIDYSYGDLVITPCELYLNLKNYNEIYSGAKLDLSLTEVLSGSNLKFLTEESFEIKASQNEIRNAGSYSYTVELKDQEPANFDLRISGGSIVISKCEVEVQLRDYTDWKYTGDVRALVRDDAILSLRKVGGEPVDHLNNESFRLVPSGTLKNVGEYTYTVRFEETIDDRNHELYIYGGDITISQCEVTVNLLNKTGNRAEAYDGTSHFPTAELAISDDSLKNTKLRKSDFKIVAINGDAINASEELYLYTVQMIDSREAENYRINVNTGSVKVDKCEVKLTLPDYADLVYNGKSRLPKIDEAITGNLPDHLKTRAFEIIVTGGDMKSVGEHTYTVGFRNTSDEDNHDLIITNEKGVGKVVIDTCEVELQLKYYTEVYNAEVHELSFDNLVGFVSCADPEFITGENLDRYFELYCAETIRDARSYTYGIRFINRDDYDNFNLKISYSDEHNKAKFEVTKIKAGLTATLAERSGKTYDGKVYTLVADGYLKLSEQYAFVGNLSATGETPSATVDVYPIGFDGSNVRIYNNYGENISSNFEITSGVTVYVEITPRNITFTLDNYLCSKGNEPRQGSSELRRCLGVSSATPLLSGYTVNFEDVYIALSGTTITVYDFDGAVIYNEEGEVVTENFNITNEGISTSEVIAV